MVVREMIALLGDIVRDPSATSNEWYQLAQFHRLAGDRAAARKCLQELTRREPNNLFYVAVTVDDHLSELRLEDARPLVARLATGAQDGRVAATAARFYTLANEPEEALELIDRYVRAADAGTADGAARQRQAAELLDQLARLATHLALPGSKVLLDGACERYRASLRPFPDAVVPMAGLLAFHGDVQPAFDELERHKGKLSPTSLATAGVAVLRSGHASPAQFQMVKGWIDEALSGTPGSLPLKLSLGELHALRQDFALAEQVYREVLKADPKNPVALNNLAWILAPRPEVADQALKLADRAIELYGATGEMLDTRARILISAGKYDRAVADLTDAIHQSGTALRYFHLAVAQLRMEKPDDAVKTFRQARARGLDAKAIHPHDLPVFKALNDRAVQ
jgi:tetratricopeptide (TPR) repeat protein